MTTVNIFDDANPYSNPMDLRGEFFKFDEVGARIQGTLVGVFDSIDSYNNEQFVYVLKTDDGTHHNVSFRKTNTPMNSRLSNVALGQIIGFAYEGDVESKKSPTGKRKDIKLYEDRKYVDQAWVEKYAAGLRTPAEIISGSVQSVEDVPVHGTQSVPDHLNQVGDPLAPAMSQAAQTQSQPVSGGFPQQDNQPNDVDALTPVRRLAEAKGLTTDEDIKQKTGLEVTEDNVTQLILTLSSL